MNQEQSTQFLNHLKRVYRSSEENGFALFLGAGVNGGTWAEKHPACFSWPALVKEVAGYFHEESVIEFTLKNSGTDWVKAATQLFGNKEREHILDLIDHAIYNDTFTHPEKRVGRMAKHRILEWKVFKNMETLRAIVAFSAAINKPDKERSMRRNPKVGRILTTNYDFFFSAAWPRYTSMKKKWWPRTWRSESINSDDANPIVYLHGYLPYSKKGNCDLILLDDDYKEAYQSGKNAKFVLRELKDTIKKYTVIFVGFSFADRQVIKILESTNSSKTHFAFLHQNDTQAIKMAIKLGLIPIEVSKWSDLPKKLALVYLAGISKKELERTGLSRSEYWSSLWNGQEPRTRSSK